ncbi:MAG: hypothetical protein JGK21_23800 [Microcoleus sp. PH2017_22_RUC_O_B]|uniref:hypothetical protein n=1 Tax=unclassified Microcoleus TaxID=2642155 RepID=UPI001DBAEB70|nr:MULTISPECIES: hypothetical protein [unclassified Microcoleus]MCC3530961.1 hypothetical protein [Microcoleus sp. PH2017_21_RUC_O_A]MCC3543319.1 hypothetical protein [Microcoleus sp. PH2017_22_RUC_O_B]
MFAEELGSIASTGGSIAGAGVGVKTIQPSGFSEREELGGGGFSGGFSEGGIKVRFGSSTGGGVSEKLFFGSVNAQLKVLLPVSGFGVIVVFAPNKSPIK